MSTTSANEPIDEGRANDDTELVDVTFRLRVDPDVQGVSVVADFNEWSHTAHPMDRIGDHFQTSVPLPRGRQFRYRYLIDSTRWENDWDADDYVPNDYGGDDSVVIT